MKKILNDIILHTERIITTLDASGKDTTEETISMYINKINGYLEKFENQYKNK